MKPASLSTSDQVRIISPSGSIDNLYIDGATRILTDWGYKVTEGKFARESWGRFAGTIEQRLKDIQEAFDDPSVKAILCSRGGYGVAQLIDMINFKGFCEHPKWLIGFSDITILHNAINNLGIASIHGIMAKHLTELPQHSDQVVKLHDLLSGKHCEYKIPEHAHNRTGNASGKLVGGNLSVLMGLRGSIFDVKYSDSILFIEDISEKPYHIDRMMQNLRLSGVLSTLSGLIVGQFSDCDEDPLMMQTIEEIISSAVSEYDYPVCFNFPAGHVDYNLPLILGNTVQLKVEQHEVSLEF